MEIFGLFMLCMALIVVFCLFKLAHIFLQELSNGLFGNGGGCLFWGVVVILLCSGAGFPFGLLLLILYAMKKKS